jgi:NADH:ubiquinone oxidoreductase subunit 6 (subunit J)
MLLLLLRLLRLGSTTSTVFARCSSFGGPLPFVVVVIIVVATIAVVVIIVIIFWQPKSIAAQQCGWWWLVLVIVIILVLIMWMMVIGTIVSRTTTTSTSTTSTGSGRQFVQQVPNDFLEMRHTTLVTVTIGTGINVITITTAGMITLHIRHRHTAGRIAGRLATAFRARAVFRRFGLQHHEIFGFEFHVIAHPLLGLLKQVGLEHGEC